MPIDQFTIRRAESKDVGNIVSLGSHVFTLTFGHSVEPHELQAYLDEAYTENAIRKDIQDPSKDVMVAVATDDTLLGFSYMARGTTEPCVEHVERLAELQRLYVHPSSHGKGVGKALAVKVEEMAKDQGFENLWLGVWEENPRALKAYSKWGYRHVGEHDFVVGTVRQTDYIYLKAI